MLPSLSEVSRAFRKQCFIGVLLTVLAGCATTPAPEATQSMAADRYWMDRKVLLSELQHWKLSGRIAVSDTNDSWRSSVRWQHYPDSDEISFLTISGQQTARLKIDKAGAVMQLPDEIVETSDVTGLLHDRLGWTVPLDSLRFWVVGLPVPELTKKRKLDEKGRLKWLEQAGWQIDYKRYASIHGLELPKKIMLHYKNARIRLVVDEWGIAHPGDVSGHVANEAPGR